MRLIARGYQYKEVAKELFISIKTVETHVSSVLRKLQLSSRHELTAWAIGPPPALTPFPARQRPRPSSRSPVRAASRKICASASRRGTLGCDGPGSRRMRVTPAEPPLTVGRSPPAWASRPRPCAVGSAATASRRAAAARAATAATPRRTARRLGADAAAGGRGRDARAGRGPGLATPAGDASPYPAGLGAGRRRTPARATAPARGRGDRGPGRPLAGGTGCLAGGARPRPGRQPAGRRAGGRPPRQPAGRARRGGHLGRRAAPGARRRGAAMGPARARVSTSSTS